MGSIYLVAFPSKILFLGDFTTGQKYSDYSTQFIYG